MGRYFLTRRCDPFMGSEGPIADRVNLRTAEDMQRWEAVFPIPGLSSQKETESQKTPPVNLVGLDENRATDCCQAADRTYEGILYVCEEFVSGTRMVGARMHYAIQYEIHVRDGRIDKQSDLWMGALYRIRKVLQWRLPLREWFSHEPIRVLPWPTTNDPKLLGISDYTKNPGNKDGASGGPQTGGGDSGR